MVTRFSAFCLSTSVHFKEVKHPSSVWARMVNRSGLGLRSSVTCISSQTHKSWSSRRLFLSRFSQNHFAVPLMIYASCNPEVQHALTNIVSNLMCELSLCLNPFQTPNLPPVAGQFSGSLETLAGLYQVILSQRSARRSGNFRFFLNERDSEQRGDSPLTVHRSATAKSTIWIDSSPYLGCPLNRRLMNLIRLVRRSSHSENPTSRPTTWPRVNTEIHTLHPDAHTHTDSLLTPPLIQPLLMHYVVHVCTPKSYLKSWPDGPSTCAISY